MELRVVRLTPQSVLVFGSYFNAYDAKRLSKPGVFALGAIESTSQGEMACGAIFFYVINGTAEILKLAAKDTRIAEKLLDGMLDICQKAGIRTLILSTPDEAAADIVGEWSESEGIPVTRGKRFLTVPLYELLRSPLAVRRKPRIVRRLSLTDQEAFAAGMDIIREETGMKEDEELALVSSDGYEPDLSGAISRAGCTESICFVVRGMPDMLEVVFLDSISQYATKDISLLISHALYAAEQKYPANMQVAIPQNNAAQVKKLKKYFPELLRGRKG